VAGKKVIASIFARKFNSVQPVVIAIYGGLPDINHFDVASELLDYPVRFIVVIFSSVAGINIQTC
jgi:hypothetical protein